MPSAFVLLLRLANLDSLDVCIVNLCPVDKLVRDIVKHRSRIKREEV